MKSKPNVMQQQVIAEQVKIQRVEKESQIAVQDAEIQRRERESDRHRSEARRRD